MLADKVKTEIVKLQEILLRRGIYYEDEKARLEAMLDVETWMIEDKREVERIEIEAAAAAEVEAEQRKRSDPSFRTREMFKGVKINIPRKEM